MHRRLSIPPQDTLHRTQDADVLHSSTYVAEAVLHVELSCYVIQVRARRVFRLVYMDAVEGT